MAEAGLQVFADNGLFQIDGSYRNYTLKQKVQATVFMQQSGRLQIPVVQVSAPAAGCIVAVRAYTFDIGIVSSTVANGMRTWLYHANTAAGTIIDFFIYDKPVLAGENYGLEVYNAAGQLVFTSTANYMKVKGFWITGYTQHGPYPPGMTVDSNTAIVINRLCGEMNSLYDPFDRILDLYNDIRVFKNVGGVLQPGFGTVYREQIRNIPPTPSYSRQMWESSITFLDVTRQ